MNKPCIHIFTGTSSDPDSQDAFAAHLVFEDNASVFLAESTELDTLTFEDAKQFVDLWQKRSQELQIGFEMDKSAEDLLAGLKHYGK